MSFKRIIPLLMALLLGISMFGPLMTYAVPAKPLVRFYGEADHYGNAVTMPDVTGTTFKIAAVVENADVSALDLYGFDVQFNWTTTYLHYVSRTITTPVDTFPTVQAPSPYAGILNADIMKLKEIVNESNHIPLGESGTMGWIGYSSQAPATGFNDNGTMFVFTFNIYNQPYDYEAPSGVSLTFHWVLTSLSSSLGLPISHDKQDLVITLYPRRYTYPAVPMLKILPEEMTAAYGTTFEAGVWLMGADGGNLNPSWDVAGLDFYLNFNATVVQAMEITIDPNGTFGSFWADGTFPFVNTIDNAAGFAHVAFVGLGATHTPVSGTLMVASVKFNVTYIYTGYPPPKTPMTLLNPLEATVWYIMDADNGIVTLSAPVGQDFTSIYPFGTYPYAFNMTDWIDVSGDGKLSAGDDVVLLNKATAKEHDYYIADLKGSLKLTQNFVHSIETYTAADLQADIVDIYGVPPPLLSSGGSRNGTGIPDWTGTVNITYPVQTINSIHVTPQIGSEYDLTPADYTVNPDGSITLNRALDEWVLNELIGTMPVAGAGWPSIAYFASSIQSVWIDMHNGTARYAYNSGYHSDVPSPKHKPMPAGGEWWFDDDYPWELESWWATGYCDANLPINPWPTGTDIYVNYTAVPTITIDYKAPPDTAKYFMQWPGTYESFLTILDPTNTTWTQIYGAYNKVWNITAWVDNDYDARLSNGDELTMVLGGLEAVFTVDSRDTQIRALEYPCVQDIDPLGMYYTNRRYVEVAGFPHPERPQSPWFGRDFGIPLPVEVENAFFTSPFQSLGRDIDLYTDYPDTFNGRNEYNMQIDAYGPQSTIKLIAKVTYAMNPVQSKPVTFSARHGEFDFSFCNFTGSDGIAWVEFGLPWPCDDPEGRTFGIWNCSASVSIREVTVTDTLTFESGWLIEITEITPNPTDSFHIGQHLNFTIKYTSISHQIRSAVFTLVVTDDLDVPIAWWVLTAFDVVYGADQTVTIQCIEVPKWTFVGQGKVWANIYTDLPQNGGVQYGPEARISIGLTI